MTLMIQLSHKGEIAGNLVNIPSGTGSNSYHCLRSRGYLGMASVGDQMAEFTSKVLDVGVGLDEEDVELLVGLWKKGFLFVFWDTDPLRTMVCNGDTVLSQSRLLSFKASARQRILGQNPDDSATVY